MFGIINYGVFIISAILLNLTPGNDTMYILGRSISNGRKAGILSAFGISLGCIIHTILASLGLSVIFARSALAFDIVRYLGAAYFIYLGIRSLMTKSKDAQPKNDGASLNSYRIFFQGTLTNVLNPKVALFFLAFLPQFIDLNNPYGMLPFLLLGFTFVFTGTIWCVALAIFAARLVERFNKKLVTSKMLNRISGIIYIGLGINLLRANLT